MKRWFLVLMAVILFSSGVTILEAKGGVQSARTGKVKGHPYVFATNFDSHEEFAGYKAKELTINILKKYKLVQ